MKTFRLNFIIVMALAVVIGSIFADAVEAQIAKRFSRFANPERDPTALTSCADRKAEAARPAAPRRPAPMPPDYPRYRLIDLGTLGGPESNNIDAARNINNRGQLIAVSETAVPDPNCYFDCYFIHGILRQRNGDITDLPFPAGIDPATNVSFAGDINAAGLLAGFVTNGLIDPLTDFPQLRPTVWSQNGASVTDLGTFGGNSGEANQVNRHGEAVGVALNEVAENPDFASFMNGFLPAATRARAFLWQGSALQDLGTLGGDDAFATAINESGTIFGMSYTDTVPNKTTGLPTTHPFLWRNGQMQDLGTLGGTLATPGSFAAGPFGSVMNEFGQAIGTSTLTGDDVFHAFLWNSRGGTMADLGTLGGSFSEALAINSRGMIVGRADLSPNSPYHHAVLWHNGTSTDLGVLDPCQNSIAVAINSLGDVVGGLGGCTNDPNGLTYFRAFIWKRGNAMADLNDLVTPPSVMHIEGAAGINDRGEIVANAFLPTGELHAVLLVPIWSR